MLTEQNKFLN